MPSWKNEYDRNHNEKEINPKAMVFAQYLRRIDTFIMESAKLANDLQQSLLTAALIRKEYKKSRRKMNDKLKTLNYREAGENEGSCFNCKNFDVSDGGSCAEFPAQEYPLFMTNGTKVCDAFGVKEVENPLDKISMMIEAHLENEKGTGSAGSLPEEK